MSKYKELCQIFSLKEIIQKPTGITSTTSSFLDHILTNASWKISQKGVIDVGSQDLLHMHSGGDGGGAFFRTFI